MWHVVEILGAIILCWKEVYFLFSNSLIIREEKTKEITTVTVVWIPDLNSHKMLWNFALNFSLQELRIFWEAISKTRKSVSSGIQTPRNRLKKTRLRLIFSTHFSLFGYPADETLFVVFGILLLNSCYEKIIHRHVFHLVNSYFSGFLRTKLVTVILVFGKEDLGQAVSW